MNEKKKVIYIPIEIKYREFHSFLYLTSKFLLKNFRVVIGNKSEMYRLIDQKSNKGGVFLYKGGGRSADLFLTISKKVDSIVVLDQELGVAVRDIDDLLDRRYYRETLNLVDRFYYLGDHFASRASKVLDIPDKKIKVTGWPRVDLWKMGALWSDEAEKIKNKFGEYILFSSDFGANSSKIVNEKSKRSVKWTQTKTKEYQDQNKIMLQERYDEYRGFLNTLYALDKMDNIPHIIVRPHIVEDCSVWEKDLEMCRNISVIRDGAISPWIVASSGVLHCGCTSAFEARLLGKKVAHFIDCSQSAEKAFSVLISQPLKNIDDFVEWANRDENESDVSNKKLMSEYVKFDNHDASDEITQDIDGFCKNAEPELNHVKCSSYMKIARLLPRPVKKAISTVIFMMSNPGLRPLNTYDQKMPGGITRREIVEFFGLISFDCKDLSVVKIGKDLFAIDKNCDK